MKKIITMLGILLAGLSLAACGANHSSRQSQNASFKAENSSLQAKLHKHHRPAQARISDEEYAMMGYLALASEDSSPQEEVNNLKNNHDHMYWHRQGNKWGINFGAHGETITVTAKNVLVTYDATEGHHMGTANGHRTYSKTQLRKEFGKYKDIIDQVLHGASDDASSDSSSSTPIRHRDHHDEDSNDDDDDDDYDDFDDNDEDDDDYDDYYDDQDDDDSQQSQNTNRQPSSNNQATSPSSDDDND